MAALPPQPAIQLFNIQREAVYVTTHRQIHGPERPFNL
jgi:hypothetical protein